MIQNDIDTQKLKAVFDVLKHCINYKHSQEWARFLKGGKGK